MSAGALARVRLQKRSATAAQSKILVKLPNGETRQMEAGPSSVITKAVVEVFAPRFLSDPAVMWISESGNKVIQRDDELAKQLGLKIETDKLLPDTILVDLAPAEPLVVFVEAVATDGPVTEARRSGFTPTQRLHRTRHGRRVQDESDCLRHRVSGSRGCGIQEGDFKFGLGIIRMVPE